MRISRTLQILLFFRCWFSVCEARTRLRVSWDVETLFWLGFELVGQIASIMQIEVWDCENQLSRFGVIRGKSRCAVLSCLELLEFLQLALSVLKLWPSIYWRLGLNCAVHWAQLRRPLHPRGMICGGLGLLVKVILLVWSSVYFRQIYWPRGMVYGGFGLLVLSVAVC